MIKLSKNRTSLSNLDRTIKALDDMSLLIEFYSEDKPGPAYARFEHVTGTLKYIQFDRSIILVALKSQRQKLVDYLATLGVDANS